MLALEGKQLGNYDVIRRIRMGGMGAVYEGKQRTAFGRRVAIKVILGNYADDPEMRRRFAREARTVARLHHPHILPLIEFGDEQGILYLVMPFIEGGTLTSYLRRSLPDLGDVGEIFLQLLDAVEYAHDEGLIHRDIKSSNVLLKFRRSGSPYVYLADFGLVRTIQQAELEQVGQPIPLDQVPGTPHYMAPEQTRGIVTTSSDIYALGVLLYQMLVGELPYDDPDEVNVIQMHLYSPIPTPCEHDASIPVELGEVVCTAMAKHAEERFANIAEFREAFLRAVNGSVKTGNGNKAVLLADDVAAAPGRPVSTPLASLEQAEPVEPIVLVKRRARRATTSEPLRERPRQPITDSVKRSHRRFTLSVAATMLVPMLLLFLLIMPRVLGVSIFPVGFPVFGVSPEATVTVTPQSAPLQDTYILIASSQVKMPDLEKRIIPDRLVRGNTFASRSVQTTGTKVLPGIQARGEIFFDNRDDAPVSVQAGTIFVTNAGVQVELTQQVVVPERQKGHDGTISAAAASVLAGSVGNIPSQALATTCCDGRVLVTNEVPFSGGQDARAVHVVAQADLDGVRNALQPGLQRQVMQQLQQQLNSYEVMAGSPTYSIQVSPSSAVGSVADQVQVQVNLVGTSAVYNSEEVRHVAGQLLTKQAMQTLGNGYELQGIPSETTPHVVQQRPDGMLYLSVSVHGVWVYLLSAQQVNSWARNIKGASPAVAAAYLKSQVGVADVQIRLPFGTDHLPTSIDQIQIVVDS